MLPKILRILLVIGLLSDIAVAQEKRTDLSSSEIRLALEKFGHLGRVLYMAAHPDDENTRLIAYLDNGAYARTAYLSLTRGDGGQNLIGTEKGAELGLIRTQELLEARSIDRGEQFFSRAVDFGYSKNPEETFEIWDKDKVLADAVRVIRQFKPDVIITRFPPNERAGHGHHTASAMLAEEAMDAAADKNFMNDELGALPVHEVKRLYWNTSPWWFRDLPDRMAAGDDKIFTVDVGAYNPLLGQGYTEMASESRSMHKSQGFGSSKSRGEQLEYLEYVKGDQVTDGDLFQGIARSWEELKNGQGIHDQWEQIRSNFDATAPEKSIPALIELRASLGTDKIDYADIGFKRSELDRIILACAGVYVEAIAPVYSVAPGEDLEVVFSFIRRSDYPVTFSVDASNDQSTSMSVAEQNKMYENKLTLKAPEAYSAPYWLDKAYFGVFQVDNPNNIGKPESDPAMSVWANIEIDGHDFRMMVPVEYKWTDRVRGGLYRPVHVLPAVTASYTEENYIFTSSEPRTVELLVKNHSNSEKTAIIEPCYPENWTVEPEQMTVTLTEAGTEKRLKFQVTPSDEGLESGLSALIYVDEDTLVQGFTEIDHEHIEIQTLLPKNGVKAVRIEVEKVGDKIGYIMGSGDDVPKGLEQLGYEVVLLDQSSISTTDLSQFQAVIAGIRAYNTLPWLKYQKDALMEYIQGGGNYIVQYNTSRGVDPADMGPYSFALSRDRVTDEYAKATMLAPEHPIMTTPNALGDEDFDGWVQERGLYFPNEWSEEYTPLLRWADKGESDKDGGLIVGEYGEGAFIYTGISFFREIPAGVPGAFRLLANIVSYEP